MSGRPARRDRVVLWVFARLINPVARAVLRSPAHRLLSGSLMLLSFRGTRSGRTYTIPVQYVRSGDVVVVYPGHPERKSWWRNVQGGAPVVVRIAGRELPGRAELVGGEEALADLRMFVERFPATRRSLRLRRSSDGRFDDDDLRRAACVIVRIRLSRSRLGR